MLHIFSLMINSQVDVDICSEIYAPKRFESVTVSKLQKHKINISLHTMISTGDNQYRKKKTGMRVGKKYCHPQDSMNNERWARVGGSSWGSLHTPSLWSFPCQSPVTWEGWWTLASSSQRTLATCHTGLHAAIRTERSSPFLVLVTNYFQLCCPK